MEIKLVPNIKVQIAKKNISQREISELIGVDKFTVSRWANGVSVPPVTAAYKLAIVLDCKVDDLWTYEIIE